MEQAALKVHVRPFQAKKLSFSHTSVDVQHAKGFETLPGGAGRFE